MVYIPVIVFVIGAGVALTILAGIIAAIVTVVALALGSCYLCCTAILRCCKRYCGGASSAPPAQQTTTPVGQVKSMGCVLMQCLLLNIIIYICDFHNSI